MYMYYKSKGNARKMWKVIGFMVVKILFGVTSAENAETPAPAPVDDIDVNKFGGDLVAQLRNDANLDLSADEEYEDLRAELLAYHTALAKISENSRRSLATTACWRLGGICVNFKLCSGFRFLTEVPGCKDHHNVCCFTWNQYRVKDMRDHGIGGPYPWSTQNKYGGPDIDDVEMSEEVTRRPKKKDRLLNDKEKDKSTKKKKPAPGYDTSDSSLQESIEVAGNAVELIDRKKPKKNHGIILLKNPSPEKNLDNKHFKKFPKSPAAKYKNKKVESNTETLALILKSA